MRRVSGPPALSGDVVSSIRIASFANESVFEELQTSSIAQPDRSFSRLLVLFGAIACIPLVAGHEVAVWLQPTLVGLLWGGLFVAGFFLGGMQRGRPLAELGTVLCCWLFGYSFQCLTDLAGSDSLLIATLILSGGWITVRLDQHHFRRPRVELPNDCVRQWSISDLAMATLIVACLTHALMNLTAPPMLLFCVLLALSAGLSLSWIAYRWAWTDDWPILRLVMVLIALAAITSGLCLYVPTGMTMLQAARWMLTGPINVIAAQAVAVLFALALVRFEARSTSSVR